MGVFYSDSTRILVANRFGQGLVDGENSRERESWREECGVCTLRWVKLGWDGADEAKRKKKKREREKRRPKLGETGRRDSGHARIDEATSGAVYSFSDCNNFQWQEGKIGASITITNQ
jgi:hypothetical protein